MRLCHLDELPDGRSRGFDPARRGQDSVLIVRRGSRLHAWLDACPHHGGTPMAWRKDEYLNAAGTAIVCHAHGAQFDIETGRCTLGPCLGQSLHAMPLRVDTSGDVYLMNPEETRT
ncbi:Rieske 2Fe-2S domain-containing protein [Pelomonas sp. KK5]|uniref:Rieske (2Fe-2S) protein n=1 Tax=Pelomonas sp. KK5 TaxID=1855730 RepID=UPI00097C5584|nr:Rieske 2Fe-2S domain-containing protein [Pelomonas sp. KK5]